jgi:hypothetical protein
MKKISFLSAVFLFLFSTCLFAEEPPQGEPPAEPPVDQIVQPGPHDGPQMPGAQNHHQQRAQMFKSWLEKEMPDFSKKLEEVREQYPEAFEKFAKQLREKGDAQIFRGGRKADDETKGLFKEILQNELDSFILAQKYNQATDAKEKENLKQQIIDILNKNFDLKEKIQQVFVQKMEKRIQELKELIAKRKDLKSETVNERFQDLTKDNELTKW